MKILFISDIHGIATNLNVIEKKIKNEKIDKLVCLGDLYYAVHLMIINIKLIVKKYLNF